MRSSVALLGACIAAFSSVTAVMIPKDMPDGLILYNPSHKRDGNSGLTLLELYNASAAAEVTLAHLNKRNTSDAAAPLDLPISSWFCDDHNYVAPSDYIEARLLLNKNCDTGFVIGKYSWLGYKVGSALVYSCSLWGTNRCGTSEIDGAMNVLNDQKCHSLTMAGYVRMNDWAKMYGRQLASDMVPCTK